MVVENTSQDQQASAELGPTINGGISVRLALNPSIWVRARRRQSGGSYCMQQGGIRTPPNSPS